MFTIWNENNLFKGGGKVDSVLKKIYIPDPCVNLSFANFNS